jgi:hypothetical protein
MVARHCSSVAKPQLSPPRSRRTPRAVLGRRAVGIANSGAGESRKPQQAEVHDIPPGARRFVDGAIKHRFAIVAKAVASHVWRLPVCSKFA